jgi:uncharacterized protein (TIGR02391 family)
LNAIVAVFDLLRARTGLDKDGALLVAEALSLERPRLIISTLSTESGQSEQKGFIQILQGAYLGVRNPKAHSLTSDLDVVKAAQYLVFASLLARTPLSMSTPPPAPVSAPGSAAEARGMPVEDQRPAVAISAARPSRVRTR